jgi:hypothetical protein
MVHVVFNEADIELLKSAMELDERLSGEIRLIRDDYAVGPLDEIYTEAGVLVRKNWWVAVLEGGDYSGKAGTGLVNDEAEAGALCALLDGQQDEHLWIWAAQNAHDVCGYYWLLSRLKPFQGRVHIVYINNLPFINEKGNIFYPVRLSEIRPSECVKAGRLARPVTPSEFELDPDEWEKICRSGGGVRVLEGGKKLVTAGEDHYDAELRKFVMPQWQKAAKVIQHFQAKARHGTGDAFLLWRLKDMVYRGVFDTQGKIEGMRDFEVRIKVKEQVEG